jgi:PAS domain S-box-containing protein
LREKPGRSQEVRFHEGLEQFWKTVVDTMLDGLLVVDGEGVILAVNQAMERITGFSREELVGQPCTILKCHTCLDSVALEQKNEGELFRRGFLGRRKCVMEKKNGAPLSVLKNATILKDGTGRVVAGVENFIDLSEVEDFPATLRQKPERPPQVRQGSRSERAPDERRRLIDAINEAGGKKSEAARLLGISRVTLWKLLKAHDILVDKIIRS